MRILVAGCLFVFSLAQHWAWPDRDDFLFLDEAVAAGNALAQTGTLADPFHAMPTGPTAHVAPGFPLLVAGIVKIWGPGLQAYRALAVTAVVVQSLFIASLPFLAEALGMSVYAGLIAGCLALFAQLPTFPMWESHYAALLCVVVTGLICGTHGSKGREVSIGAVWGVLVLLTPAVLAVWLAWLAYRFVSDWKSGRARLVLAAAIPLLIVGPWLARNFMQFGRFVLVRDNLGLELNVSNNPCAMVSLKQNIETGCHAQYHPNVSVEQAMLVRSMGEVGYNDRNLREAVAWIGTNPAQFLRLTGQRMARFWFPAEGDLSQYDVIVWIATLLSIPGLYLLWRERRGVARVLGGWLLLYPAIYYVIQFDPRYRGPILWVTLILAGHAVMSAGKLLEKRSPIGSRG